MHQPPCSNLGAQTDPPAYRERLERMTDVGARQRSRAGLWLLGQLLGSAGYPENSVADIGFGPHGQPVIDGAPAFSISHSESLVVCALRDDGAVGVDVEYRRPRNMARMARLLDGPERAHVEREPRAFFDYWCAREATVKASGRVGLKRIRALKLDGDVARLDDRYWYLHTLALDADHAGCLASDRAITAIELRDVGAEMR